MINIGGNPLMILLAIVAALGGVGLYFVRNFRPELARDHDIFFSAIALVYGIILLAFNFRMEITTQLAQVLLVGFSGWFAVESLVLRQALSNQARRSSNSYSSVDDPVRSDYDYRVELDTTREIAPRSQRGAPTRRMRGTTPDRSQPTELRGDVDRDRRSRRPRRPVDDTPPDAVIDVEEDDIRPVSKPRRPKPGSPSNSPRDRDRPSNMDNYAEEQAPPRRRRPRPSDVNPSIDLDEREEY